MRIINVEVEKTVFASFIGFDDLTAVVMYMICLSCNSIELIWA